MMGSNLENNVKELKQELYILETYPIKSRELSIAVTKLQECIMWLEAIK